MNKIDFWINKWINKCINKWIDKRVNENKKRNNFLKSHQIENLIIYRIQQKFQGILSLENL